MDNVSAVVGKLLLPKAARSLQARIMHWPDGRLELIVDESPEINRSISPSDYQFGPVIPGLAVDIQFKDGSLFTPDNHSHRWLNKKNQSQTLLAFLERNLLAVALATILVPLSFWWMVTDGVPYMVDKFVVLLPDSVSQRMGKDSLALLDRIYLQESKLSAADKEKIEQLWHEVLAELEFPPQRYQILFRFSDEIGANAFALPDGTVVVTDDIVALLQDRPKLMTSVLLHEIGHVERKHSLKLVGRSVSTTLLFAVFLSGIDGIGEVFLGAGSSMLSSAFSREMELEADEFAFDSLEKINTSPAVFAEAMHALQSWQFVADDEEEYVASLEQKSKNIEAEPKLEQKKQLEQSKEGSAASRLTQYFSSHPLTQDRIDAAEKRGEAFLNKQQ